MGPKRHFKKNWYRMPIVRFYWNAGAPFASVAVCQGCSRKRGFGLSCVSEDCGRTFTNLTRIATSLVFLTTFFLGFFMPSCFFSNIIVFQSPLLWCHLGWQSSASIGQEKRPPWCFPCVSKENLILQGVFFGPTEVEI